MDDGELIARAQTGDRNALEDLLQRHYSTWYQICRRMMGNDADAADATQEGMVAVVKGLPRFDGRAKFSTWSYRVVMNRCHDELRRRNRGPVPTPFMTDASSVGPEVNTATRPEAADPARHVVTSIDLDEKLKQLSEDYRTVLVLRDLVGCDYAEIADVLMIPIGTVRSRLARARGRLASLYTNDDDGAADDNGSEQPDVDLSTTATANKSVSNGNFSTSSTVKPLDL